VIEDDAAAGLAGLGQLIREAEGQDEEILQGARELGHAVVLRALFTEVFLDHPDPPTVQYELDVGGNVRGYLVAPGPDGVAVTELPWSPAGPPPPGPEIGLRLRQDPLDFAALNRAVFGPIAGTEAAAARLGALLATGDDDADWPAFFRDRARAWADLKGLAVRFGSDKWGSHWYTQHYQQHLGPQRHRVRTVLEIGVGGYADAPGGSSLEMWRRFFPRAVVYGVDTEDKSAVRSQRVHTLRGDQADPDFLAALPERTGRLDVVVDDGSHRCADQIATFHALLPHLTEGGCYAIEDLETSYWPGFGGTGADGAAPTAVEVCKSLVDGLNHRERLPEHRTPPVYSDEHVVAVHFFHGLCLVRVGANRELGPGADIPDEIKRSGWPDRPMTEWAGVAGADLQPDASV
jgi:hypothetical protein